MNGHCFFLGEIAVSIYGSGLSWDIPNRLWYHVAKLEKSMLAMAAAIAENGYWITKLFLSMASGNKKNPVEFPPGFRPIYEVYYYCNGFKMGRLQGFFDIQFLPELLCS